MAKIFNLFTEKKRDVTGPSDRFLRQVQGWMHNDPLPLDQKLDRVLMSATTPEQQEVADRYQALAMQKLKHN